jgi:glyoxylase-like metal-dependent hydrolase (beta-lactamase superfamily II)
MRTKQNLLAVAFSGLLAVSSTGRAAAQAPGPQGVGPITNPIIPENAAKMVSDHVSVIMSFPNIAFVVGTKATLVVDTGLGPKNGVTVTKEAQKLARGKILYLTTTHYHPEHAAGDAGFPADTILIRPSVQQEELEKDGMRMVGLFSGRNAQNADLLKDVKFRTPDIVFDKEMTLDLGGVTARLFWMGTAHTQGDELIYVLPDKTLISGDVVQNKMLPNLPGPTANLTSWINILGQLKTLDVSFVVSDHGELGDGSLIPQEYNFLNDLKTRALELKSQGKSAQEAGATILEEFKAKYSNWPNLNGVPGLVAHIYSENP